MLFYEDDLSANPSRNNLLLGVLEETEVALLVIGANAEPLYMNSSARRVFGCEAGVLPPWTHKHVKSIVEKVGATRAHIVEHWPSSDITVRVRARPHAESRQLVVLEVTIANVMGNRQVTHILAHGLGLSLPNARVVGLLWCGMSNEEIAKQLNLRVGTVKSRLYRIYQRLGVNRRAAAVLRAAEVLAQTADRQ